jgi:GNAT superfamily N-acetyltransferase
VNTACLRAAVSADVPAIHGLIRELAQFENLTDICCVTATDLSDALFGEHRAAEAIIAERDGALVGYALFFHNFSTFLGRRGLYLEDLYVRHSERGHGLGTAMLRYLAALAVARGCARFEWTVLDWNQNAIDFYEKMGATIMPEWRIVRATGEALVRMADSA